MFCVIKNEKNEYLGTEFRGDYGCPTCGYGSLDQETVWNDIRWYLGTNNDERLAIFENEEAANREANKYKNVTVVPISELE